MTLTCQNMSMMNECDGLYTFVWANFPNVKTKGKKQRRDGSHGMISMFCFVLFCSVFLLSILKWVVSSWNYLWIPRKEIDFQAWTPFFFYLDIGFALPISTNTISYTQISNSPVGPLSKIFCTGPHLICALMSVYLQSCPTLPWPHGLWPTRLLCLWDPFRQEYWSGLSFLSLVDLPNPGIKPRSLVSPALVGRFFTIAPPGKPHLICSSRNAFNTSCFPGSIFFTKSWKTKAIKYRGRESRPPLEKARTKEGISY